MSEAFEACGQSDSIRDDAFEALLAGRNWLHLSALSKGQRVLLIDGILASMSTSRDQLIDWQASAQSAAATTKTLSEILRSKNARAFYKTDPPSLLFAFVREPTAEYDQFQCIFAGQIDGEFQKTLDAMSRADKIAGIEQANAGLDFFKIRIQATNDSDPPRAISIDAQIGHFTANILPDLNHKPTAQVGFSLFRYTQK